RCAGRAALRRKGLRAPGTIDDHRYGAGRMTELCSPFRRAAWNRKPVLEPMQRYERGDTSAATARIAELRKEELKGDTKASQQRAYMRSYRNSLPVPRELITPPEVLASHWKPAMFHAVCEGVDAKPTQPAASGRSEEHTSELQSLTN